MNEGSRGYEDDLGGFRANGKIHGEVGLFPVGGSPEIGSAQFIRVATGGRRAFLQIDDNELIEVVENNAVLPIPLLENRPYFLKLLDQQGHLLDEAPPLVPTVIVPQLDRLSVADATTYAEPTVRVDIQARDAEQVEVAWRLQGDEPWQSTDSSRGLHFVPVPGRPGRIQIRISLRSRHAGFCREAQLEILREVSVVHPGPTVTCTPSNRVLLRTQPISCEIECAWVCEVRIDSDGNCQTYLPSRDQQVLAALSLNTDVLGERCILVHMRGLDGQWHERRFDYVVQARPIAVALSDGGQGSVRFDIQGGRQARLRIPIRNLEVDVPCSSGTIAHDFVIPVNAVLVVTDDNGTPHEHTLVLDRAPHLRKPFSPR